MQFSKTFLNLSEEFGSDIFLVQGAGGNSSIKLDEENMLIKASGTWLSDANKKDIFVKVNASMITDDFKNNQLKDMNEYLIQGSLKPSIETLMHVLIPYKYTFHLHCLRSLAAISSKAFNPSTLDSFLKDYCIVEYAAPGLELAKLICNEISLSISPPKIYFLKNHGIIISSNDLNEIKKIVSLITKNLDSNFLNSENLKSKSLEIETTNEHHYDFRLLKTNAFDSYKSDQGKLNALTSGVLYPDHAVFLGEKIFYFKDLPDANEVKSLEYFIVYQKGLFIKKDITKIKFSMIQSLIHIGLFLTDDAYEYINSKDLESLLSRDDESHRIALN